jgi:hypothetical protein
VHGGGFGDAEVGVDVASVPLVLGCAAGITESLAGGGQAVMGAGLLVEVPAAASKGERSGEAVLGPGWLAGGEQGCPGTVERLGLAAAVADVPQQ